MKYKFVVFFFLLLNLPLLAQEEHTYGWVSDADFYSYIKYSGLNPQPWYSGHRIGYDFDEQDRGYEARSVSGWHWTENSVPQQATLTKIEIRCHFLPGPDADLKFAIHNIDCSFPYNGQDFYSAMTTSNQVYETTLSKDDLSFTYAATSTSDPFFNAFASAIASGSHFITLGFRVSSANMPSPTYHIGSWLGGYSDLPSIELKFWFTTPIQKYTFRNIITGTTNYGQLIVDGDEAHPLNSGDSAVFTWPSSHNVRTACLPFLPDWLSTATTYKFCAWDANTLLDNRMILPFSAIIGNQSAYDAHFQQTTPALFKTKFIDVASDGSSTVNLKDPWRYYLNGSSQWTQSNVAIQYSTPFQISNSTSNSYGGVFQGRSGSGVGWIAPYYEVSVSSVQDIGGVSGYFQNWSVAAGNAEIRYETSTTTPISFTQANTTIVANYKAHLATGVQSGLASGSQRKIAKTSDGNQYLVYESAGAVWMQWTSDGTNWSAPTIMSINSAKSPSLTPWGDKVVIVWQETYGYNNTYSCIKYKTNNSNGSTNPADVAIAADQPFTEDMQPVVACDPNSLILFAWRQTSGTSNPGIYYSAGTISGGGSYTESTNGKLLGTSSSSSTPTVAACRLLDTRYGWNRWHFPLAWTEGSSIYYRDVIYRTSWDVGTDQVLSTGDGYSSNYSPSVMPADAFQSRVCWIGKRWESEDEEGLQKTQSGGGSWKFRTLFTDPGSPGNFWIFGEGVNSTNINSNVLNGNENGYVVAWSASSGSVTKYTRGSTLGGTILDFLGTDGSTQIVGRDIQMCNGTSYDDMRGVLLDPSSSPYRLKLSDVVESMGKANSEEPIYNGREGIVYDSLAQFYFTVGDAIVDGRSIEFVSKPETLSVSNLSVLNTYLITKPFTITNSSSFSYDVQYGMIDSLFAAEALTGSKAIEFKVQLIDAGSKVVIGEYDNIRYDANNLFQYKNIGYQVQTDGIGMRDVQLRLVVSSNFPVKYSLNERHNTESLVNLGKKGALVKRKAIGYERDLNITTYALEQNYPNPFNPATQIMYQLKDAGNVRLSVYDLLGREVAVLVNERQESGFYSVTWNAGGLSSGTYIYRVSVKDEKGASRFNETRRMMLVK
jgi:hypothetical protein